MPSYMPRIVVYICYITGGLALGFAALEVALNLFLTDEPFELVTMTLPYAIMPLIVGAFLQTAIEAKNTLKKLVQQDKKP